METMPISPNLSFERMECRNSEWLASVLRSAASVALALDRGRMARDLMVLADEAVRPRFEFEES